jgi:hypothetical protein
MTPNEKLAALLFALALQGAVGGLSYAYLGGWRGVAIAVGIMFVGSIVQAITTATKTS